MLTMMFDRVFAAVTVVERDGMFLAVARKDDPQSLGFAGGKLEPGETAEAAAIRELEEETGLKAPPSALARVYVGMDDVGHVCMAFTVSVVEGVATSREGSRVGWVARERLLERTRAAFPDYNRRVFERLGVRPNVISLEEELRSVREELEAYRDGLGAAFGVYTANPHATLLGLAKEWQEDLAALLALTGQRCAVCHAPATREIRDHDTCFCDGHEFVNLPAAMKEVLHACGVAEGVQLQDIAFANSVRKALERGVSIGS
jgi:8-oxo-dGTP pyrophosphatase MutT (NUDIX family)